VNTFPDEDFVSIVIEGVDEEMKVPIEPNMLRVVDCKSWTHVIQIPVDESGADLDDLDLELLDEDEDLLGEDEEGVTPHSVKGLERQENRAARRMHHNLRMSEIVKPIVMHTNIDVGVSRCRKETNTEDTQS
jgi:hypothetical protein